jgi:SM-20-related protein
LDKATVPPQLAIYLERIDQLRQHLNKSLFLSLLDFEIHLTVYPVGSYYKRHLDQFKKDDRRKLSVICYLNEGWKSEHGGQLRIYHQEGEKEYLPIAGRLICFRSDRLEHEVLPATRERLSLTGWMLDRAY